MAVAAECRPGQRGFQRPASLHPAAPRRRRRPLAPTSRTPGQGHRGRHAGHGRSVRGAAPRAPEPVPGRPASCACTGGGAPRRQPISAGRPGPASQAIAGGRAGGKTSSGAPRGAAGGKSRSAPGPESRRAAGGLRLRSSAKCKARARP
uniref:Uncharacterized protein n=1 Tax=Myotis myotis TaxID=51298 RepID=A0A7J7TJQ2_MYOMY|nr:hypothetical protein mMyoMyo1_009076 [Myotis myotis]